MSVLVVDDEPDIVFVIRETLEDAGYRVVGASHGAQAMAIVKETPPDLVVTDLMMPVMSGQALIQSLRSNPETAAIPILLVSATVGNDSGADESLSKPFRMPDLLAAVQRLTGRVRAQP